jgi:uncharacterized protein
MRPLSPVEVRVLGALAEKALATPDAYPLSLNALVAACNQKTAREPVMDLSEAEVARALDDLTRLRLAGTSTGAGSRVEKYRHLLDHAFGLDRAGQAALGVLLLRGFQTAGEVRARTGRMFPFETLEEAEAALRALVEREEPLTVELPVQPGRKEPRYAHLLSGEVEPEALPPGEASPAAPMAAARAEGDRIAHLESLVEALAEEVSALREELSTFRRQFE